MLKVISKIRPLRCWLLSKWYRLSSPSSTSLIRFGSYISKDLEVGNFSYIGPGAHISPKVILSDFVMIGPNVSFVGGDHRFDIVNVPMIFSGRDELNLTHVGRDVWIGAGSIILAGVTIGDGSIIGAGSVVTKNIDRYSIYAGNPARKIRSRFDNESDVLSHVKALDTGDFDLSFADRR